MSMFFPPQIISTTIWEKYDEDVIDDWICAVDKALCFDFGIPITVKDIVNSLSDDVRINPPLLREFVLRNSVD